MDFEYITSFLVEAPEAYERLLLDCMIGDPTLFTRADEVEAAWSLVDPILSYFQSHKPNFPNYAAGTWGPREADDLLERDGRHWRNS
jgi:glucose-6-phosphate 1-dehydrogenase